jgi:2-C-methyl-D-erythritol 4-phosphate cytidylyltransferase
MKTLVIVPAGGSGLRMGGEVAKQYLLIAGMPILAHTLGAFQRSPFINEILPVVPEGDVADVRRDIVEKNNLSKVRFVVSGGKERQDSVRNALIHVRDEHEIVVVHDGVRPFVTGTLIEQAVKGAKEFGAVVVGVPVRETVKEADESGRIARTVLRDGLWLAQTPQAFRKDVILAAYEKAEADGFYGTDDASLVERTGIPVRMIPGDADNIKVTTQEDLVRGERIVSWRRG